MLVILDDLEHRITVQIRAHRSQFFQAILNQWAIVDVVVKCLLFTLINGIHCRLQYFFNAIPVISGQWHHASAQQATHHLDVQFVSALFQFIPHVQCNNHGDVHVHELGCEVQVTLQVSGINNIEYRIGMIIPDIGADIHFLW